MTKKFTVALPLIIGFIGGLLAHYVAPPVVQAAVTKEIRAQSFVLVDSTGATVGTFTSEAGGRGVIQGAPQSRVIVLRDADGHVIWTAGGTSVHPISRE